MEQIIIEVGGTVDPTFPFYVEVRNENGMLLYKLQKGYISALNFADDLEILLMGLCYNAIRVDSVPPL